MGKRTTFDAPGLRDQFLKAVSAGASIRSAALFAGVSERTYYMWMSRAQSDNERGRNTKYVRLLQDVQRARARAEVALAGTLQSLARNDGRLLLSMLARIYPEQWGSSGKRLGLQHEQESHEVAMANARAQARLTEARAKALEHAVEGGGSVMLMPQDVLHTMPAALRAELVEHLGERGITVLSPPALGAGVTDREIAEATPAITIDAETS